MKKVTFVLMLKMLSVAFLVLLTMVSCREEQQIVPLDSSLIEGIFSPSIGKFMLNGEDYSEKGVTLQFSPSVSYKGKYDLKIFGIVPYPNEYMETLVNVVASSDKISFSVAEESKTPIRISGVFRPGKEGNGYYLEADCECWQNCKCLIENPLVLNFTKSFFSPDRYFANKVEIEGTTYTEEELVADFYAQIGKIYAKENSCLQLKFNTDCTLDIIASKETGSVASCDTIMTVKCWYSSLYAVLEFSKSQALEFMKRWVGTYGNKEVNYLFVQYANTGRYALVFDLYTADWNGTNGISFSLQDAFRDHFLYLLMKSREVANLSEVEQQKMRAACRVIFDHDRFNMPPYLHTEYPDNLLPDSQE